MYGYSNGSIMCFIFRSICGQHHRFPIIWGSVSDHGLAMGLLLLWYVLCTLAENIHNPYATGFAGVVWFVAWILLVFNTPADHPRISPKEQHYIESTIQAELLSKQSNYSDVTVIVFLMQCMT